MTEAIVTLSFDQYLTIEQRGERHELVGGRLYAMSGGTERHDLMAGAIRRRLEPAAIGAGCRPFDGNRLLRTPSGSGYYPDLMVVCGPAADVLFETDATLIVEVLSPSTQAQDRREKLDAYWRLPSLEAYLLAEPVVRRFEVARPGSGTAPAWQAYGEGGVIDTRYGVLNLDEIYAEVDSLATT